MKTADKILFGIYTIVLPIIIAINYLFLMLLENTVIDIEFPFDGIIYFNICFLITVIYIVGYFVQGIISGISWIISAIKKKKGAKNERLQ